MTKKITGDMVWPEWTDALGQTYRPGDLVAIAIVNRKSPQMILARVDQINRVNSYGEEITTNKTFELDEPIRHERECFYVKQKQNRSPGYYDRYSYDRYETHVCEPSCTEWIQTTEVKKVPSCTVKATPIADLRGFGRSTNHDGKARSNTYSIPENIILVEKGS